MKNCKEYKEIGISFLAAVLIITAVFAAMGIYPFGNSGISCADMKMQHLGLVREIYDGIKNHSSIFISYKGGLGTNLFASSAGYITDPLNLLFLLFKSTDYQEVWLFIIIIKFGLIAASVSYCLKKSCYTSLSGTLNIALSLLYALNGLNTKFTINVSWLNFSILLPLTLLGIEKIVKDNKPGLLLAVYTFSLLLNLNFNAYISGLFAAFYFVFYCVAAKAYQKPANICKSFFICVAAVIFSVGLSAFAFIPAIANILSGYSNLFASSPASKLIEWQPIDIVQCFTLLQPAATANTTLHGYVGVAPLLLTLLLFVSDIPKREKIAAGIFVVFMLLSIMIRPLYLFWHAFREPTGFYGRFLYTVSYLFIILSARCCGHLKDINIKKLLFPAFVLVFVLICSIFKNLSDWFAANLCINLVLALLYMLLIYFGQNKKTLFKNILPALFVVEAVFMCTVSLMFLKKAENPDLRSEYTNYINTTAALTQHINDDGFYRVTDISTVNPSAPMTGGYNGIETFSSQTNQKSLKVLSLLGIWSPYDYRTVNKYFNSVVSESLFDIKYIFVTDKSKKITNESGKFCYISDDGVHSYRISSDNYKLIYSDANGEIYRNETAFPLMFAANTDILNKDEFLLPHYAANYSAAENLEKFLSRLLGGDEPLFEFYEPSRFTTQNMEMTKENEYFTTITPRSYGGDYPQINYSLDIQKDGEYFIDEVFDYPQNAGFAFSIDNLIADCIFMEHQSILSEDAGPYKKGDTLNFTIYSSGKFSYIPPRISRLNEDVFKKYYNTAQNNALKNIRENEKGDITALSDFDEEKLIFTSLSYDKGFHVYIDGDETETTAIADAFLGYYVPAGKHNITIKYVSPGFKAGAAISAIFAVLTAAFAVLKKVNSKKSLLA